MAAVIQQPAAGGAGAATAPRPPGAVAVPGGATTAARGVFRPTILQQLLLSGSACAISTLFTNPIDMIKCRLQLQMTRGDAREYKGMLRGFVAVVRQEGPLTLWSGYNAALLRAYTYSATRLGMYEPIRNAIAGDSGRNSFSTKLLAGVSSGSIAAVAGCPFELIKVRMQGKSYKYSNPISAAASIAREDGVFMLWKGVVPYMVRGALLTATQLGIYDQTKEMVRKTLQVEDGLLVQLSSAMVAGLVTTTVTQPADMVKTRMMNYSHMYKNPAACILQIFRTEGVLGFYRGWLPNYARLGPHTLLTLTVYEQLRWLVGWKGL